jgi:hypothetical protein
MRAWWIAIVVAACSHPPPPVSVHNAATKSAVRVLLYQARRLDRAVVLGCASGPGRITGELEPCLALIGDRRIPAMNRIGSRELVGARERGRCRESGRTYDQLVMAGELVPDRYEIPTDRTTDASTELLVWPGEGAAGLQIAHRATGPFDVAAARVLLEQHAIARDPDPMTRRKVGGLAVTAVLRADFDGDRRPDELWLVAATEDLEYSGLFLRRSSRPGLQLVRASIEYLEAVAAVDLDGDGVFEVVLSEHYAAGFQIWLARYRGDAFEVVSGQHGC